MGGFKILAIIPARGGSKGVPGKNIKELNGKPLIYYSITEAKKSKYINRIITSTDDMQIADIARKYGSEVPFLRPTEISGDKSPDLEFFKHGLSWLKENEGYIPDILVHLRPTAPLRKVKHIDAGIKMLLENPTADSVRSVVLSQKHPFKMWKICAGKLVPFIPEEIRGFKETYNLPIQSLPEAYIQNGSVDIIRTKTIIDKNSTTGDLILALLMKEEESININTPEDFMLAEILMQMAEGNKK
jgi:N-acylneuraminate cytidylyltransferase